jgi:hypothetical protein
LRLLNDVRLVLLAVWLGAAVFFSFVVAPSAFLILRQFNLPNANEIAGALVTRLLSVINLTGFALSLFLIVATIGLAKYVGKIYLQLSLFAVMGIATSVGHWLIAARMRALRLAMFPIDRVSPDDPRKIAFDNLHHYSVMALALAMLAVVAALVIIRSRAPR